MGVEVEDLPRSLNEYIAQVMKGKDGPPPDWIEKVAQVRIAITEDRLAPTRTRLFVIPDTPLDGDETKLWRDWHNRGKKLLSTAGIKLDATASKASTQWRRAPT